VRPSASGAEWDLPGIESAAPVEVEEGRLPDAPAELRQARILVVDDDEQILRLLSRTLGRAGYSNARGTTDPCQALTWVSANLPDLVILDIQMPALDGYEVLSRLRRLVPDPVSLPVLAITGAATPAATRRALALGANDLVRKPFDSHEVALRVGNLLRMRRLHVELELERRTLEQRVRERTRELSRSNLDTLRRLARAAEYRDDQTGQHTQRVGELSARLAGALGVPSAEVQRIRVAASLHDVGKIGVPDEILLKNGPLTAEERAVVETHTAIGADLLSGSSSDVMNLAATIARSHHEWFDGSGYPEGLVGEAIPLAGRIVAVADFFDAVTTSRPYRDAWPETRALAHIRERSGTHFDPAVAQAFLGLMGATAGGSPSS
jgi:putative two-component system response regulator